MHRVARRLSLSVAIGCTLRAVPALATGPPPVPAVLELDLPEGPAAARPSPSQRRRALLASDRWNRALACPRARAARQPDAAGLHRCAWTPTAALRLAPHLVLQAGVSPYDTEWDGMYSHHEDLVLLQPAGAGATRVVCTVTQWRQSVTDCATELLMRRLALRDLDGDGVKELCLETVLEQGAGLFEVMALETHRGRWVPTRRHRRITAFRFDPRRGRLIWIPRLAAGCPRAGYALPVKTKPLGDAVAMRRRIQGAGRGGRPTPRRPAQLGYSCGAP